LEPVQLVPADSDDLTVTHTDESEPSNHEEDSWARKEKLLNVLDVEESLTEVESRS